MMDRSDEELVRAFQAGDRESFSELYRRRCSAALRTAYLIVGNRSDSENVVQDTFIKVWQNLSKLKNPVCFEAWFMRILVRTAWQYCRKRGSEQPVSEVWDGAPEPLIRAVGDVELSYTAMPYKFVPLGYEFSDEDLALQESGALEISYGSDEVEETVCCGVSWRVDGLNYYLFGWDLELGGNTMLDMAEELLAE